MKRKTKLQLSTGLFVPAMALAGASFAQTSASAPGQDRPATAQDRSNTATPAGSTKARDSAASDRAATPSTNARDRSTDRSAATPSAQNRDAAAQQPHAMRASKIIGKDVKNAQGDKLGEIQDLVIDTNNQRIRYAVLSHGGVLGIGDKLFAYPVSLLKTKAGSDDLVLNVSKDKLDKAPGFDKSKWPFGDARYGAEVDRYYGTPRDQAGTAPVVRASKLIGMNFDDRSGKDAGEIEDLIVDVPSNRVQYAIVDFDDSWAKGSDGKLVAIPLKSLTFAPDKGDKDDHKLVIGVPAERVDMSRAFSENQWPDFSGPTWRQSAIDNPAVNPARKQAAVTR